MIRNRVLLVTGMAGAGQSTVLRTLEDLGWEFVDNLPLNLLSDLLATGAGPSGVAARPLALGFGARTRGYDAAAVIDWSARQDAVDLETLFLDCDTAELERRYNETRRRHPLAPDRPVRDGIAADRELIAPVREMSHRVIDTTRLSTSELAQQVRATFALEEASEPVLSVLSFGFARGVPHNADIVLDMRFLRNPHWVPELRPGTGHDEPVAAYVRGDPAYAEAMAAIEGMLGTLLPRYRAEGKSYVTVAFGCTGGRHRSVHVAERMAAWLRDRGFSPTVRHRDLGTAPQDMLEGGRKAR